MTFAGQVREAIGAVPALEWVAVFLALAYLLLAIRQNRLCWACAIASAALYGVLFARGGLVMQSLLQVFYIAMAVYGWRAWGARDHGTSMRVRRWPVRWHVVAWLVVGVAVLLNGALLVRTDGGAPMIAYADAGIAWASVLTTWLVARKVLENWLYWIAIDIGAAALYAAQGLQATAVLFLLYAALAVGGYVRWRRDFLHAGAASA